MALPFLPHNHIEPVFERLASKAGTTILQQLVTYIRTTWIQSTQWTPTAWSIFKQSVRTNNDVEGWHFRLNHAAKKGQLGLYVLAALLHREARLVDIQVQLVSDKKVKKIQHRQYAVVQGRIFDLWDKYLAQDITPDQLLRSVSHLYGPSC